MRSGLAVAAMVVGLPLQAEAADFAGAWLIDASPAAHLTASTLCVLNASGNALGGPCAAVEERSRQAAGRLDSSNMAFHYRTDYNGTGVRLDYRGKVQPDGTVQGTVTSDSGHGSFQARSMTDTKSGAPVTWKISAAFSDSLRYVALCTFKADGQHIAGPCTIITGDTLLARGTANGSALSLHVGQTQTAGADYAGSLQPDGTLAGTVKAGGTSAAFKAVKQ